MVMPRKMVIRFARGPWAVRDRFSSRPHSRIRLPNIKKPTRAMESGAISPAIRVTIMGNKIFVVLDTDLGL